MFCSILSPGINQSRDHRHQLIHNRSFTFKNTSAIGQNDCTVKRTSDVYGNLASFDVRVILRFCLLSVEKRLGGNAIKLIPIRQHQVITDVEPIQVFPRELFA